MQEQAKSFGTFGGVFVPSILTIFGAVMFLIAGKVIGNTGIFGALAILCIAESVAIATGLSISSISTNTEVKNGGAYFLISRALGPGFGGAIGICIFFSQTIAVPFYIIAFSESIVGNFPDMERYRLLLNLTPLVIMFIIAFISTELAIKTQYIVFTILMLSIVAFIGGAARIAHTTGGIQANWLPDPEHSLTFSDFFKNFAIFFPAVTGFLAGVNMSGDLKDPGKSLPRGTMLSILFGFLVYIAELIYLGLAFDRASLLDNPFNTLKNNALFGTGFLVYAGVWMATLSSALGSLLGAPRVLQALAMDNLMPGIKLFGMGRGATNEPVPATILTFCISAAVLWWGSCTKTDAANGFSALNILAALVAMFTLLTYALINLAAFVESFGANPSFRPKFKLFNWSIALFGGIASVLLTLLINPPIGVTSLAILAIIYIICRKRSSSISVSFNDARRGFIFSRIRTNILALKNMPPDPKNWRPIFTVLVSEMGNGLLLNIAEAFNNQRGIISSISIIPAIKEKPGEARAHTLALLKDFAATNNLTFFPRVIESNDMDTALNIALQSFGSGPMSPNTILCGWPHDPARFTPFLKHVSTIISLGFNCIIAANTDYHIQDNGYFDVWWRGKRNGSLMLIMAYLLTCTPQYRKCKIRLIRLSSQENDETAHKEMELLVADARINAEILVLPDSDSFERTLKRTSCKSAAVFMGFFNPEHDSPDTFFDTRNEQLYSMPTTFFVCSNGDADMSQ